jgi:hypothetical protein
MDPEGSFLVPYKCSKTEKKFSHPAALIFI